MENVIELQRYQIVRKQKALEESVEREIDLLTEWPLVCISRSERCMGFVFFFGLTSFDLIGRSTKSRLINLLDSHS